jgi:hypothetical protein
MPYENIRHNESNGSDLVFYMLIIFSMYLVKLYIVWLKKILYALHFGEEGVFRSQTQKECPTDQHLPQGKFGGRSSGVLLF